MSDVTVVVEDPSVTVRLDPNGVVAAYFAGLTNNRLIKTSSGAPADSLIAEGTITGALTVSKSGSTAREVTFPDAALTVAGTNVAQTYTAVQTYGTGLLVAADVQASGSGGLALKSSNGTTVATFGAGPGTGTTLAGGLVTTGTIAVNDTTDASSTTTGSLQTDGGLGVAKAAHIGTTLTVGGTGRFGSTFFTTIQGDRSSNAYAGVNVSGTACYWQFNANGTIKGYSGFSASGEFEVYSSTPTKLLGVTASLATFSVPVGLPSYTVAGVPSAATAGQMIYVSNESGGAVPAFSDGTNWRRVTDRAIVT